MARPCFRKLPLLLLTLLSSAGCATTGTGLEPPSVSLIDIAVKEARLLETVFEVELRVLNPNDAALTVTGVECALRINDRDFARGASGVSAEIPAYGSAVVPVTVYSSIVGLVRSMLNARDALAYELKGTLRLGSGAFASRTVPFSSEGRLDFDDPEFRRNESRKAAPRSGFFGAFADPGGAARPGAIRP
jgi:LEA14-like dessication related protein